MPNSMSLGDELPVWRRQLLMPDESVLELDDPNIVIIMFRMIKASNAIVIKSGVPEFVTVENVITGPPEDQGWWAIYTWQPGDIDVLGKWYLSFRVEFTGARHLTFPNKNKQGGELLLVTP